MLTQSRRIVVLIAVVIALLTPAPLVATAEPDHDHGSSGGDPAPVPDPLYVPTPDPDPFYAAPDPMPEAPRGTLLAARSITFHPVPGVPMPDVVAWHLKFVSVDGHGLPTVATATLAVPAADLGTTSALVAFQLPYNSLGTRCSPSRSHAGGNDNPNHGQFSAATMGALSEGWALVLPDHEGPLASYLAPRTGAAITLDAVRAAIGFDRAYLDPALPVGLWGFSSGSIPTLWAAAAAPSDAPEVRVVATVAGGLVVHQDEVFERIDDQPLFRAFGLSGAIGVARAHPGFLPSEQLTAEGRAVAEAIRDGCDGRRADGSPAPDGTWVDDYSLVDPFRSEIGRAVIDRIRLPQTTVVPATPTLLYHGTEDELVAIDTVDALAASWCAAGTPIVLDRLPTTHYGTAALGGPTVLAYLRHVLDGERFVSPATLTHPCHQP